MLRSPSWSTVITNALHADKRIRSSNFFRRTLGSACCSSSAISHWARCIRMQSQPPRQRNSRELTTSFGRCMICFTRTRTASETGFWRNWLRRCTSILLSCERLWRQESFSHAFEPISPAESAAESTARPHFSSMAFDTMARTISTLSLTQLNKQPHRSSFGAAPERNQQSSQLPSFCPDVATVSCELYVQWASHSCHARDYSTSDCVLKRISGFPGDV